MNAAAEAAGSGSPRRFRFVPAPESWRAAMAWTSVVLAMPAALATAAPAPPLAESARPAAMILPAAAVPAVPAVLPATLSAAAISAGAATALGSNALDSLMAAYWDAPEEGFRCAAAARIETADVMFDSLWARLRKGRRYSAKVERDELRWTWLDDRGRAHYSVVCVPESYDPRRRYPVYFYLHGSIERPARGRDEEWWRLRDQLCREDRISVFPAAWDGSRWWQHSQVRHFAAILDRLRSHYNVDENRCVLSGVSDGGTGTYFHAFRASTPWAAFLPFIGHPSVLNLPDERADGQMYVANLRNRPLFIISGENDRLYPAASLRPYLELFRRAGVEFVFRPHEGGHDVRNWRSEWPAMESFIRNHPRDPLPDRISWKTEDCARYGRHHWLILDALGPTASDTHFERYSVIEEERDGEMKKLLAFRRDRPAGQIELQRTENRIEVQSERVLRYRLLLAPDQFDFSRPIQIRHNGTVVYRQRPTADAGTLLRWACRDDDRSMLFGAEISVDVRRASADQVFRARRW